MSQRDLEENLKSYLAASYGNQELNNDQDSEVTKAFYAGAISIFHGIINAAEAGEAEFDSYCAAVTVELDEFVDLVVAEAGTVH